MTTNKRKQMSSPSAIICPSVLASDLSNLTAECERVITAGADWVHLDVMDGHFVPNLTFGHTVVEHLRKNIKDAYLDCHLMVTNPAQWISEFKKAGADNITFHIESEMPAGGVDELINMIKDAGMKVGVSLKPGTPIETILPICDKVDLVLIMTVGKLSIHLMFVRILLNCLLTFSNRAWIWWTKVHA